MLTACSTTKRVPDGDQLFRGLTGIDYKEHEENEHAASTREEVEAALATAPNGAVFGSSYYSMPSWRLWVWNTFSQSRGMFAKWMTKSFGRAPVLMSWVNPELRALVAQNVLHNHGYFHGKVDYRTETLRNPKKAKIGYIVDMGPLYRLDTVRYVGFSTETDSLIRATLPQAAIHAGDAFDVAALDAERSRIATLLRNNGYYYYQAGYSTYLADTFATPQRARLDFRLMDSLPREAMKKWYIGRIDMNMRKTFRETLSDSVVRRVLTVRFNGKRPPLRPRVILAGMKLRPRQPYSYENYLETTEKLSSMGLFSMVDFAFTPRDTTAACDTLDLTLNCVFERPWDFYVETNFNKTSIGRMGPELRMGVTRRNAFRGGEKLDINIHGSYEWQSNTSGRGMNSYQYGADASVEFPRIIAPFFGGNRIRRDKNGRIRRLFYSTPTTLAKASTDVIYRPGYYKMHIVSGEWTYKWQASATSRHELSPLTVKYQFMNSRTDDFVDMLSKNPYLGALMDDYFIPEMRYTYVYSSPKGLSNPIRWETTVAEAGNVASLYFMMKGRKWSEKDKRMFKNPYAHFVKIETDFTKTWQFDSSSKLVAHMNAGYVHLLGNSSEVPFSETFYVGGANSIRAYPIRGIGPGRFPSDKVDSRYSYIYQNGNVKLLMNLEYRKRLFGSAYGAVFLDAGNVWNTTEYYDDPSKELQASTVFRFNKFLTQMALGTGVGLRYDLDFLVLRLDWGIGLHVPYDTGRGGFFNVGKFKDNQTLHFAIGYPF